MIEILHALAWIMSIVGLILLFFDKPVSGSIVLCVSLAFTIIVSATEDDIPILSKEPTALDVYRGKTTLEITYRDSVAIDSTVVYKVK